MPQKMQRWRKKPVEIEAVQWWNNGDYPDDLVGEEKLDEFKLLEEHPEIVNEDGTIGPVPADAPTYTRLEGAVVRFYRHPAVSGQTKHCDLAGTERPQCPALMHHHGWIDTPAGGHTVCPGDYIVDIAGKPYPIEPEVFVSTHELVQS